MYQEIFDELIQGDLPEQFFRVPEHMLSTEREEEIKSLDELFEDIVGWWSTISKDFKPINPQENDFFSTIQPDVGRLNLDSTLGSSLHGSEEASEGENDPDGWIEAKDENEGKEEEGSDEDGVYTLSMITEKEVDDLVKLSNPVALFSAVLLDSGKFEIVNSAAGKINRVLLTLALKISRDNDKLRNYLKAQFTRLLDALGEDKEYVIVCPSTERKEIQQLIPWQDHGNIQFLNTAFKITYWSQDPYIAFQRNNPQNLNQPHQSALVHGVIFNRYEDQSIPIDICAQSKNIINIPTNMFFQGGNLLIGEEFVLMGKDYLVKNCGRPSIFCAQIHNVQEVFKDYFNDKEVISVGLHNPIPDEARKTKYYSGVFQPIFHIDIFLSITGVKYSDNKEILMFGRLKKAKEILLAKGIELDSFHFEGDEYFEEIQKALEQTGRFHIVEVPLFRPKSFLFKNRPIHYYLTYNNAQVENYRNGPEGEWIRKVTLPQFRESQGIGIDAEEDVIRKELDKAAVEIWETIGFKVQAVPQMEFWAMLGGSVHCMTKVLSRTNKTIESTLNPIQQK